MPIMKMRRLRLRRGSCSQDTPMSVRPGMPHQIKQTLQMSMALRVTLECSILCWSMNTVLSNKKQSWFSFMEQKNNNFPRAI